VTKKSGTPIKLTGAQLMSLRYGLTHHLWENPHDAEMADVLRALPRPPIESPRIHFDITKVRTIRVSAALHEPYARALRLVSELPFHASISGALLRRAELLEGMGGIERLGALV